MELCSPLPVPRTIDPVDGVLAALSPFERAVVQLHYRTDQSLLRIAESLASTPELVAAALMGVYRQTAAALEA